MRSTPPFDFQPSDFGFHSSLIYLSIPIYHHTQWVIPSRLQFVPLSREYHRSQFPLCDLPTFSFASTNHWLSRKISVIRRVNGRFLHLFRSPYVQKLSISGHKFLRLEFCVVCECAPGCSLPLRANVVKAKISLICLPDFGPVRNFLSKVGWSDPATHYSKRKKRYFFVQETPIRFAFLHSRRRGPCCRAQIGFSHVLELIEDFGFSHERVWSTQNRI